MMTVRVCEQGRRNGVNAMPKHVAWYADNVRELAVSLRSVGTGCI
jgi:hypothetical protein